MELHDLATKQLTNLFLYGSLRAPGLIAKIPHAHRYRVTTKGEAQMSAAIYARYEVFPKELQHVA